MAAQRIGIGDRFQQETKYHYLNAGHIGQNLYLAATSLGLGCCTIGAFYDDEVNQLIGVDGQRETTVYLGAVGHVSQQGK